MVRAIGGSGQLTLARREPPGELSGDAGASSMHSKRERSRSKGQGALSSAMAVEISLACLGGRMVVARVSSAHGAEQLKGPSLGVR